MFAQIIELARPVGTDHENIRPILLDVVQLLPFQLLRDNKVRQSGLPDIFHAFLQAFQHIQLAPALVVAVCGHADDEAVPQRPGSFQKIDVPRMKQVESAVGDNRFHDWDMSICFP